MGLFDYVEDDQGRSWQTKWLKPGMGWMQYAQPYLGTHKVGGKAPQELPDGYYSAIADDGSGDLASIEVQDGHIAAVRKHRVRA